MEDRQSLNPGRIKLTFDDGTIRYAILERADGPTVVGTPLNKNTLFNSENSERYACDLPSEAFTLLTQESVVLVPVSSWSSTVDDEGYYTNRVDVLGMKESYSPIFSVVLGSAFSDNDDEGAFEGIKRMTTHDGYVVFKATDVPVNDLNVRLKGV